MIIQMSDDEKSPRLVVIIPIIARADEKKFQWGQLNLILILLLLFKRVRI